MLLILIKSLKLVSLRFGFVFCSVFFLPQRRVSFFFLPGKSMPRHDCYIYYF